MSLGLVVCAISGCGQTSQNDNSTMEAQSIEATSTIAGDIQVENELLYGTLNLTYADFYYGEINNVEPETDAAKGQYDVADKVTAQGFKDEGMYDAVTSATTAKSKRFNATYFEEHDNGVNILGVKDVNVAISKALYDDVKAAIDNNTVCANALCDIVNAITLKDETPVEYKMVNSDGTLSKTVGTTKTPDGVTTSFTTITSWGNYQIALQGLEVDVDTLQGGIIETADGKRYGLEHEDNLWINPSELSFAVVPFTEPHGNEVAYKRFEDMVGKQIVKLTYMIANGDDIEIPMNYFVNLPLADEFGVEGDEKVVYSADGTQLNMTTNFPADSNFDITAIRFGRSNMDIAQVAKNEVGLVLPADFAPGSYTVIYEDEKYCGVKHSFMIESGLTDKDVIFKDNTIEIKKDCGLTGKNYIDNISTVLVNGEKVNGRGLNKIIFDENMQLNHNAEMEDNEKKTPVFADGKNEVTLESAGFPSITFSFEK